MPAAIGDRMFVIRRCTDLVEFVSCYGPLLDSVRLKQLLSSREWEERKTCLTILSEQDKQVLTGWSTFEWVFALVEYYWSNHQNFLSISALTTLAH